MLVRRISQHVKDQNWFAVFLDFFIVIVGILIAFQIDSWADQRSLEKAATASLTMLLDDLARDMERLDVVAESQKIRIDALDRITSELMQSEPRFERIAKDIDLAGNNTRTLLVRDTVYDTMEKEGHLLVLLMALRRKISATYTYDFPALATAGLQMDDNTDEVDSRCIDVYWDWELRVLISYASEDLARLRNCITNLKAYSMWYLSQSDGDIRKNAEALKTALEIELGVTADGEQK